MGNFGGDEKQWKEWAFSFKIICKGQSWEIGELFEAAEKIGRYKEGETL